MLFFEWFVSWVNSTVYFGLEDRFNLRYNLAFQSPLHLQLFLSISHCVSCMICPRSTKFVSFTYAHELWEGFQRGKQISAHCQLLSSTVGWSFCQHCPVTSMILLPTFWISDYPRASWGNRYRENYFFTSSWTKTGTRWGLAPVLGLRAICCLHLLSEASTAIPKRHHRMCVPGY